jgi:hypothetical protein
MRQIFEEESSVRRHGATDKVSLSVGRNYQHLIAHPTALPSRNIQQQSTPKFGEKLAPIPKIEVRKSVVLKGKVRPSKSDMVPQPMAPIIIWFISSPHFELKVWLTPAIVDAESRPTICDERL